MKKIIIAIFIVIATLGIAAGTTTKKNTSKNTTAPKKVVTDPYVGWWYHESDENIYVDDQDTINYITKKNQKYFIKVYQFTSFKKEKGIGLCKNRNGTGSVQN
jgi:flagellar basal body-associated protein FliL